MDFIVQNRKSSTWKPRVNDAPNTWLALYPASVKVQVDPAQALFAPFQTLRLFTLDEN